MMEAVIIIITGVMGAVATYLANVKFGLGPVKASAALSLVVALFFHFFPGFFTEYINEHVPLVFMGATFIGMVSSEVLRNYFLIAVSGAVFSLIYLNASTFFSGFGGGLGTTASISLLVALGLRLFSKSKKIRKIFKLKKKE